MHIKKNIQKNYALTSREVSLLKALKTRTGKLISELAYESDLPRTTVYRVLTRLKKRGFVEQRILRNRWRWFRSRQSFFEQESLSPYSIRGVTNLLRAYENACSLHKDERLLIIQSNVSAKTLLEKVAISDIIRINRAIVRNKIIVEAIVQDNFKEFAQSIKNPEWLESFEERVTIFHTLPAEHFAFETELLIFWNEAYILDWNKEEGVHIVNENMVRMLKTLFIFMQCAGNRRNFAEELWKLAKD